MQNTAKNLENIEVLEVVPKSAPLKTSLDVFQARKLLELARAGMLRRNAVTRHSEGADSAADLWADAAAADPSWDGMSGERESRGILYEHIE